MRLVCFLPDDPALRQAVDAFLAKRPKTLRIEWASLGDDPEAGLRAAIGKAHRKHGFAIVDGPHRVEDCQLLDRVCRELGGRGGLPRAVFFAPKTGHDDWRAVARPLHAHYHSDRRAVVFGKPAAKPLLQSVRTASRAASIIRWGALVPMVGLFLAMAGGVALARDGLLRAAAVAGLEGLFGARAGVIQLDSVFTPAVALEHVAVADRAEPMRNLFEFDRAAGGVEVGALFAGRVRIPELALEGLRFDTARTESGALPPAPGAAPEPPPAPPTVDAGGAGPSFEAAVENLQRMLAPPALEELEAVREARTLVADAQARVERIERRVRESTLPKRLETAKAAAADLAKVEPPASFQAVADAVKELAALRPDPRLLDTVRKDLAAAVPNFDREKKAIEAARGELNAAGTAVEKAQAVAARAKEIRKFSFLDALKIKALLEDLREATKGLQSAATRVDGARKAVAAAQESTAQRVKEAAARLQAGRDGLAAAQAAVDRAAGELPARTQAVAGRLEQARADLAAGKAQADAALARIQADLAAAGAEADELRREVEEAAALATAAPGRLTSALERDQVELARRYSTDRFTAEALMSPLIGDSAVEWLRWTLAAYDRLKPLLPTAGARPPRTKTARAEGTVYAFPGDASTPPRFWIGRLAFSGTLRLRGEEYVLKGEARNLASDLTAVGADATVELLAEHEGQRLRATIRVARSGEVTITVTVEGIRTSARLANRGLRLAITQGTLGVKVEASVGPAGVRATARLTLDGLVIAAEKDGLDARLAFLGDVLGSLRSLDAEVDLRFAGGRVESLTLRTGADAAFADAVRASVQKQAAVARDLAFARIEERVAEPRREAEGAVAALVQRGGPAVEGLLAGLTKDGKAVDKRGVAALARYDEMVGQLDAGADPTANLDAAREAIAALTASSVGLDGAAAKAGAEPLAAADGALKLADTRRAAVDAVQAQVKAELERLTGLK